MPRQAAFPQRLGVQRADGGGTQVPLDEAAGRGLPHAINPYAFPEASEVIAVLELGLNRAIAGEISAVDSLNSMSDDIYKVMEKYKYKTGELPPLKA